ncbi:MAG: carbamoyltransferase C-terminal domain-containing protein [Methylotenera sp.]|nr:carbamoyltransferase C-terminal domain-containing protein [Methylotenera sp.]MDD4925321.1 carbamoyltransferase C-terminal domain-containing protein [Methylotenera sp.]
MKNSIYQLALSVSHNSSAALMCDGKIIVAACEERFCREKNYIGYPKQSIDYCLQKAGITGSELSRVAYTTVDNQGVLVKAKTNTKFSLRDYRDYYGDKYYQRKFKGEDCTDYFLWLRDAEQFNTDVQYFDFSYLTDEVIRDPELDIKLYRQESARLLSEHLGIPKEKVEFLDHHTSHAYYAYYGSPFRDEDCIVLTMDGWGDGRNQSVWKVSNNKFSLLAESAQNDLGRIYKMATLLLGMRPDEHEFKVMGLAPYAKSSHVQKALKVIENLIDVDGLRIVHKDRPADLYSYLKDEFEIHRFDNIAGAVQLLTEQIACKLVRNIIKETGIKRIVLGGGIAMNIKMNQAIAELDEVDELYVCGSNGDESLSIGGCYLLNEAHHNNQALHNLYLGFDAYDEMDGFNFSELSTKYDVNPSAEMSEVAKLIFNGDIVGVIRGQAEFGARALGNRSILANPSIRESVQKINEAIKNRDFWMPFALSILDERHQEYIENPKLIMSPLMTISFNAKLDKYQQIEAGTHPYDKTVRPQFVSKDHAPKYHQLISEYCKLSNVPALLNTSFNLHGEPIVDTISDAVRTFELSGLDHLYINDKYLISKRANI